MIMDGGERGEEGKEKKVNQRGGGRGIRGRGTSKGRKK